VFILKQAIGILSSPMMICLALAAAGLACRLRGASRAAGALWACAAAGAYLSCTRLFGDALLGPLERQYPPLRADAALSTTHYVVVLGSDYYPRDSIPAVSALDAEGLRRLVEGIRQLRQLVAANLVVSGGARPGHGAPALGYAAAAVELGVPAASITVLSDSLDTEAEARAVAQRLGPASFVLVTSAWHMPRALRLMRRAHTHPIAAPAGEQVGQAGADVLSRLIPSSAGLRETEEAVHEYLGVAALALGAD
jgi:uncharacterized SAM-binding protein YcdF (DUF218 family)